MLQHKSFLALSIIVLVTHFAFAGKIEKGFEALKIYNYFEAKHLFEKSFKKHPTPAAYGLSTIYYRTDNPFSNIDSALKYVLISENLFKNLSTKEIKQYEKLRVNALTIDSLKNLIIKRAYDTVYRKNTLNDWNNFIEKYQHSKQILSAIEKRNELAFELAQKENTYIAYEKFLKQYPAAKEFAKAKELYELRKFQSSIQNKSIEEFNDYIEKNPNSPFINDAHDAIYKLSIIKNTAKEYIEFISEFPENRNIQSAWMKLYRLKTKSFCADEFISFKIEFPEFSYMDLLDRDLLSYRNLLLPAKVNNKWGFIDTSGQWAIPAAYSWLSSFSEGYSACMMNEKVGYIDIYGDTVIPFVYDFAENFSDGIAIVNSNEKYGIINKLNDTILPLIYDEISVFKEGLCAIGKNEKYGYINKNGEIVIPLKYDKAGDFSDGFAIIEENGQYGYINSSGEVIIQPKYDWCGNFYENRAKVQLNGKFGVINTKGELMLYYGYDYLGDYSEGLIIVVMDGKYGFADKGGQVIIPLEYDFSNHALLSLKFNNNVSIAEKTGKQWLIDKQGNRISQKDFEQIKPFNQGLAAIQQKELWGYIDTSFQIVIPCIYKFAGSFENNWAKVIDKNDKSSLINTRGKLIIGFTYNDVAFLTNEILGVTENKLKGVINLAGEILVPIKYNSIQKVNESILQLNTDAGIDYFNFKTKCYIWQGNKID